MVDAYESYLKAAGAFGYTTIRYATGKIYHEMITDDFTVNKFIKYWTPYVYAIDDVIRLNIDGFIRNMGMAVAINNDHTFLIESILDETNIINIMTNPMINISSGIPPRVRKFMQDQHLHPEWYEYMDGMTNIGIDNLPEGLNDEFITSRERNYLISRMIQGFRV
jgi:hypothetical protein